MPFAGSHSGHSRQWPRGRSLLAGGYQSFSCSWKFKSKFETKPTSKDTEWHTHSLGDNTHVTDGIRVFNLSQYHERQ